jgi:predicted NBD/HSP70 family sugar kinase
MRFYTRQHKYYCGIDLHARKMYVCIIDHKGKTKVHKNIKTSPELFFELVFPFLEDVVVGVECVFCWHPKGTSVGRIGYPTYALTTKSISSLDMHYT